MAFANKSFETDDAGNPGTPEGWTVETVESGTEIHGFSDGGSILRPREFFDQGWGNDDFINEFSQPDDLVNEVFPRIYDPGQKDRDNFEDSWGNDGFLFALASVDAHSFDVANPEDREDFEEEWSGNEGFLFDWGDVSATAAQFNTTDESVEGFIKEWSDIENFDFTFAGSPKNFHSASGQEVDGFEVFRASIQITVNPATDEINASAHGLSPGERVTFRNDGSGQLPGGIQENTTYVVKTVPSANVFTIAQSAAAAILDIQDFGTGAHFLDGDPTFVWVGTDKMQTL